MTDDEDGGLHIWEKISLSLGNIEKHMQKVEARWIQRASDAIRYHPTYASAVCPTPTAAFTMGVGAPQQGRVYSLRRLIVGGVNVTTVAAGQAFIFLQGPDPATTAYGVSTMVDATSSTLAFPQVAFYGSSEVLCHPGDKVWVAIVGGTAGQQYTAAAFWENYQDGGYQAEISL